MPSSLHSEIAQGFSLGVVRADQLIGDAELLAQRNRPRLFGEERVRAGFHQAALHAIGIHGPTEPLAAFEKRVFQIGSGCTRLLQIKCGAQPGNASTDNGNALHTVFFIESSGCATPSRTAAARLSRQRTKSATARMNSGESFNDSARYSFMPRSPANCRNRISTSNRIST